MLGRHVGRGADDKTGLSDVGDAGRRGLGQAEIHHLDHAFFVNHDVARLHVAMDDAVFFGRGQSHDDGRGDIEDFAGAELLALLEALGEVGAAHVLHGEVRHVVLFAHRVHLDDVGVDKLGRAARLAEEAFFHFLVLRGLRRQDL